MTRDSEVFTPGSAAKRLGIGGSTLRIYSVKLADVLSPSAGQPRRRVDGRPGPRLYSKKDLDVLERAKGLLARGLTYDEVALELAGRGNGEARVRGSVKQAARSEWTRTLEALNDALERAMAVIAAWQRLADGRERDVAELREKVELLEARLAEARRGGGWLRWLR